MKTTSKRRSEDLSKGKSKRPRKIRIRPLADRVLLKRLQGDEVSVGGIVIPDSAQEKPQRAEVMAVGPGRVNENGKRIQSDLNVGAHVLIGKYSGTDVKIDDTEFVILREEDVLGIIER
jgi:chaperonin GroES